MIDISNPVDLKPLLISYKNGCIRTPDGKIVAHFDHNTGVLHVDGHVDPVYAADLEEAMDLVTLMRRV